MNIKMHIPQNNNLAEFKAKLIVEKINQENITVHEKKMLLSEVVKYFEIYGQEKMF